MIKEFRLAEKPDEVLTHKFLGDLIFLTKFGSHLYGTDTPDSDTDYKGVFVPSKECIYLGKIPKSISFNSKGGKEKGKNTSDDVDVEIYSLQYFLKMACDGETVAMDMLHVPLDNTNVCMFYNRIWKQIHEERSKFYTTNLSSFVSYARKQAAKYGVKGSRLATCKMVMDFLLNMGNKIEYITNKPSEGVKLSGIWNELPQGEHIHFLEDEGNPEIKLYQVCGKKFQSTSSISHVYNILKNFYDKYGHRAKLAEQNEGIDWKAVSHALRACYQLLDIYQRGDIIYPLRQADFLREVKKGTFDYKMNIAPILDRMISDIEEIVKYIDLPSKTNIEYWNNRLINIMDFYIQIKE